jgi:hypothetical protein
MIEDRSVWIAAVYLIGRHGLEASAVAQNRGCEQQAGERRRNWLRVAKATAELLRSPPDAGDTVH